MERIYLGGRFHFDYLNSDYKEKASQDFRSLILGDAEMLLRNSGIIRLSEKLEYVGPYYFETEGMIDRDIVASEKEQIEKCTTAFFLLEDGRCPGTVSELLYAATLHKKIRIFYVRDESETESALHSPCWYPMIQVQIIAGDLAETVGCDDYAQACERLIASVRNLY